jgi:hypothetical protein
MENIVNATMPHHPASAAAHGHSAHVHTPADSARPPFRALDPSDLLYPCSAMEARYVAACYSTQTSAILFQNGWDEAGAARECGRVPELYRRICFVSLGRDISSAAVQDPAEAIRRCTLLDASVHPWCHTGVVTTLVQVTAQAEDGFAYCRAVEGAESKRACYEAVGRQVMLLEREKARREAACGRAEEGYAEACRGGAGLPPR